MQTASLVFYANISTIFEYIALENKKNILKSYW